MPIIKSQKKSVKQMQKKTVSNKKMKEDLKKAYKEALLAIDSNSKNVAEKIKNVQKKLDKLAKKNIFHENKAARKLKRLVAKNAGKKKKKAV